MNHADQPWRHLRKHLRGCSTKIWLSLVLGLALIGLGACSDEPASVVAPDAGPLWAKPTQPVPTDPIVVLHAVDLSQVIVEVAVPPSRPLTQIATEQGLNVVEQLDSHYAVLQGSYSVDALIADPDILAAASNDAVGTEGADLTFGFYEGEWTDTITGSQAATARLGLGAVHSHGTGSGVRVLVADSGVDPTHPALLGHLELLDAQLHGLGSVEPEPQDLSLAPAYGHGTAVTSLVLMAAPDATVLPARILDSTGVGSLYDLVEVVVAALDPALDVDILNFSMSISRPIELIDRAATLLADEGVLVVAAAGNTTNTLLTTPSPLATSPRVIGVAAVDAVDQLAWFSRFSGLTIDVAAPGVGIRCAIPGVGSMGPGYTTGSGTSFAVPLVSGSVASLMEIGGWGPRRAYRKMRAVCDPTSPTNMTQYGRIDPKEAAERVSLSFGGGGLTP